VAGEACSLVDAFRSGERTPSDELQAIGLQVVDRHFSEQLLLDLALTVERHRPWPLTVG
jgi:hypothetical protein